MEQLVPLSYPYPFLVLGFSEQDIEVGVEVFELDFERSEMDKNKVIDRCIEFPPEYHQAGLNILNYFGTYLRKQYPQEDAKVKIEQHGLIVRLVVESKDGKTEVIEKALEEYGLIISGQAPPERFTQNEGLILELRYELRIAQVRIETQRDINNVQSIQINQFQQLLSTLASGFAQKQPIAIDFKPSISLNNTNTVHNNPNISLAISSLNELKEKLPSKSPAMKELKEIEASLEAIEKEPDPEKVSKSPAMNKFRRFVEKVTEGNNDLEKAVKAVDNGLDIFKDLAGKYNSIAEWCGLPVVPSIFTKK